MCRHACYKETNEREQAMGMAASQARFLGLTARKTNTEYEGQQINQQRTTLGNQSANYYNQLLGMTVPVPPSVADYTKTVYTFSDGALDNSISSFEIATIFPCIVMRCPVVCVLNFLIPSESLNRSLIVVFTPMPTGCAALPVLFTSASFRQSQGDRDLKLQ